MPKTWVQSLGQEDPLEEGMATHSSILAWKTPWTEKPNGLPSMGLQRVRRERVQMTVALSGQIQYTLDCVWTLPFPFWNLWFQHMYPFLTIEVYQDQARSSLP